MKSLTNYFLIRTPTSGLFLCLFGVLSVAVAVTDFEEHRQEGKLKENLQFRAITFNQQLPY